MTGFGGTPSGFLIRSEPGTDLLERSLRGVFSPTLGLARSEVLRHDRAIAYEKLGGEILEATGRVSGVQRVLAVGAAWVQKVIGRQERPTGEGVGA